MNQGPYDRFGGRLPRSPVWLRKIPSTVSGSQGSRRGLRPAVRFAFPLGARLNTTLRARPCQELFSESFPGRPAGRGAPRLPGFGPSRRRVRHYTRPGRGAGGKPARTQDADNSSAAERGHFRAAVPGRFSMSEGFHHFDIEEAKVQSPIRMLKHFHRVQSYTCMPRRPWPRS